MPLHTITYCVVAWSIFVSASVADSAENEAAPTKVSLAIVDSSYKYPLGTDFLTVHPDGSITAFRSPGEAPMTNEQLAECLRGGSQDKRPDKTYFRLMVAHEKEVSVDTLGNALERMRELADPHIQVVVFVSLKGVKRLEKE